MTQISDAYDAFRTAFEPAYPGDRGPGPMDALTEGTKLIEAIGNAQDTRQNEAIRVAQIEAVGAMVGSYISRFVKLGAGSEIWVTGDGLQSPRIPTEFTVHLAPPQQPNQADGTPAR